MTFKFQVFQARIMGGFVCILNAAERYNIICIYLYIYIYIYMIIWRQIYIYIYIYICISHWHYHPKKYLFLVQLWNPIGPCRPYEWILLLEGPYCCWPWPGRKKKTKKCGDLLIWLFFRKGVVFFDALRSSENRKKVKFKKKKTSTVLSFGRNEKSFKQTTFHANGSFSDFCSWENHIEVRSYPSAITINTS